MTLHIFCQLKKAARNRYDLGETPPPLQFIQAGFGVGVGKKNLAKLFGSLKTWSIFDVYNVALYELLHLEALYESTIPTHVFFLLGNLIKLVLMRAILSRCASSLQHSRRFFV